MDKKSIWSIVAWSSLYQKFHDTYISCLTDPELQYLHRDGQKDDKTITLGLLCKSVQEEYTFVKSDILPFILFLGVQVTNMFHWDLDNYLLFTALHSQFKDSKNGKQKKHGLSFAYCWPWIGSPVTIAGRSPMWPLLVKKNGFQFFYSLLKWMLYWITLRASWIPLNLNRKN